MPEEPVDESVLKEQKKSVENPISKLLEYCKPYRKRMTIGLASLVIATLFELTPPYIMKVAIDEAIVPGDYGFLLMLVAALLGAYAGRALFHYLQDFFLFTFAQEVIYHLRMDAYKHMQELSLSFHSDQPTGKMMSKVSNDINRLQRFLSNTIRGIARNLLIGVAIGVILFWMNWKLALLTLGPIPIIGILTYKFVGRIRPKWDSVRKAVSNVNSRLHDNIAGIEVVKSFVRENYEAKRVKEVSKEYRDMNIEAISLWSKFFPLIGFAVSAGAVIVLWYGGSKAIAGTLTIGTLVAFNGYIWKFYQPVRMLGWLSNSHQRAAASASRVFGVLEEPEDVKNKEGAKKLKGIKGEINFENIVFHYSSEEEHALNDVSFDIEPGETVALVGPSGAGKSTIVNLLLRFYDPDEGFIKLDGEDLRDLDLKQLRKNVGIVSQNTFLFDDDIRMNISYGDPEASDEELMEAARSSAAHGFIENFPEGYDTEVGEDGVKLSGGQKQRISIARTILNDPKVLILDEATSSVDTITEVKIQKAIKSLIRGRTTIIIAHDLSTARMADRILCIKDGKIVEQGTHEELIEKNGLYKELWDMQSSLKDESS